MPEQSTEIVQVQNVLITGQPTAALQRASEIVQMMAQKCSGPKYVAIIPTKEGPKRYPRVEWWTTVGASLGLFPHEIACRRLVRQYKDEIVYEAIVEVRHGETPITRASAICSSTEANWQQADEYAIRSMAITRATGKAFRIGLSFLAVMAGLEPTPAEEMPTAQTVPPQPQQQAPQPPPQPQQQQVIDGSQPLRKNTRIADAFILKTGTGSRGPWTLYGITDAEGVMYTTFNATDYQVALECKTTQAAVLLEYTQTNRGARLLTIKSLAATAPPPPVAPSQPPQMDPGVQEYLDQKYPPPEEEVPF